MPDLYLGLALPLRRRLRGWRGTAVLGARRRRSGAARRGDRALAVGAALTFAFTAIGFWIALRAEDRLRGLGFALGVWLLVSLLYDGLVLVAVALFSDYPIERPLLALMFANPVDLGARAAAPQLDVAALMGYTGAVFQRFFAARAGPALAAAMLGLWIAVPLAFGAWQFRRKDF